jgi:hypothetical protein
MKQNKILLFGAIGVGAYLLLSGKTGGSGGGGGQQMFTLPDGRRVPVSQLPSLGYVQYQGQWYHQSQLTVPNMPSGTDPNSPQWLNILNAALQAGTQLYTMSSELAAQLSKSIKSTAVDWNNSNVTIVVKYGYQTYNGIVNPTTNVTKTYSDQQITISGNGQQTKIKLLKAGVVQKEATIDFFGEKLVGFDAGSVGITGIYIGSTYSNIDTVTSMYGIGSIYKYNHPKGITYCNDKTYSDAAKGACSYHGGAAEVKFLKNQRDYSGKGQYVNYGSYRKAYKNSWAKQNRASKSDRIVTL